MLRNSDRMEERSDHIGKSLFHFTEIPGTAGANENGDDERSDEAGPPESAVAAKDCPAEAVDDANHGIERVEKAPLVRDDTAAESDGRKVESKLDYKGDDVPEIAIFDVEGGEPKAEAESGSEG